MDERRRAYLGACAAGALSLLAGCPGDPGTATPGSTPTGTATSLPTDSPAGTGTGTPTGTDAPTATPAGVLRWRIGTDRPVLLEPVVADGTLYAAESSAGLARPTGEPTDHSLLALSTDDGSERWRAGLGAPAGDSPLVAGERVYATAGFGTGFTGVDYRVVAVDRTSGGRAWRFENRDPDQFVDLVAATDGVVLVGRNDDAVGPTEAFVSGLDVRSGRERWRYETGDVWSGTADGDSFYVGSPAGVYGLTASDGTDRWLYADAAAEPPPVAANGYVYLVGDAVLAAVEPDSGRLRWRLDTGEGFLTDRVVTGAYAVVGTFDGWLRSVDAVTGAGNWERRLGTHVWSVARRADGALVVVASVPGDAGGGAARLAYAVGADTGDATELVRLGDAEQLTVGGRTVYVWDAVSGVVRAVGPTGAIRWTADLGAGIRTVTATGDAAFVSTEDDSLLALGG